MAKEICPNCNTKMVRPVAFCPVCSRPTSHATDQELLEWDLGQWRRHVDRSVAEDGSSGPSASGRPGTVTASRPEAPDLRITVTPVPVREREAPERVRRERRPKGPSRLAGLRSKLIVRRPSEAQERDRVIVLDADHEFVYTACTSCERADWIIRTTRNEDGTYNYWCVRCSRSFKSEARIRLAWKPFLAAGSVIGALATLSIVMG